MTIFEAAILAALALSYMTVMMVWSRRCRYRRNLRNRLTDIVNRARASECIGVDHDQDVPVGSDPDIRPG